MDLSRGIVPTLHGCYGKIIVRKCEFCTTFCCLFINVCFSLMCHCLFKYAAMHSFTCSLSDHFATLKHTFTSSYLSRQHTHTHLSFSPDLLTHLPTDALSSHLFSSLLSLKCKLSSSSSSSPPILGPDRRDGLQRI